MTCPDGILATHKVAEAHEAGASCCFAIVAVDDPRMRWSLSAAVHNERRATTAANAVLDALIRPSHVR